MSYCAVVPALIPTSAQAVKDFTDLCLFAREIQIDVVDGQFTPSASWPFEPVGDPASIKSFTDRYTLEVDLMVADPITAAYSWIAAGADMLVFHVETITLESLQRFAATTPVSIGVALHGDTTLETFIPYVAVADYIQVMGVRLIGAQGQTFDPKTYDTIAALRSRFPDISISVDGSVNLDTIKQLQQAGADRFVAGSAIISQANPQAAFQELKEMLRA